MEQQHQQADGPRDEDDPPDQQGGDGPQTSGIRSHRRVIYLCLELVLLYVYLKNGKYTKQLMMKA